MLFRSCPYCQSDLVENERDVTVDGHHIRTVAYAECENDDCGFEFP